MSGHTPGPWSLSKSPSAMSLTVGLNAGHRRLGRIYTGSDEYIANARLIAAAPTLIEVVCGFRQKLATYVSVYPGDKELRGLLDKCDAAIAKATKP